MVKGSVRLSLPGWVLAASSTVFVVTWILAPRSSLSGSVPAKEPVALPERLASGPPPVQHLPQAFVERAPIREPVYGPLKAWKVALTFDDGPHYIYTKRLLKVLKRHQVRATFFINGYWLDERYKKGPRNRQVLMMAHRDGHTIGNHTYSHTQLNDLSVEDQTYEIMANHRLIRDLTGRAPTLFRPPYAVTTAHSKELLDRLGYTEALWNATAPDHEIQDPVLIRDLVMSWLRTYHGGIVMLHDRHPWSVQATQLILESLTRENCRRLRRGQPTYQVVSLDSLLRPPPLSWAQNTTEMARVNHMARLNRVCDIRSPQRVALHAARETPSGR